MCCVLCDVCVAMCSMLCVVGCVLCVLCRVLCIVGCMVCDVFYVVCCLVTFVLSGVCMYTREYPCMCVCICMCTFICTCRYVCICMCMCICICICICIYSSLGLVNMAMVVALAWASSGLLSFIEMICIRLHMNILGCLGVSGLAWLAEDYRILVFAISDCAWSGSWGIF